MSQSFNPGSQSIELETSSELVPAPKDVKTLRQELKEADDHWVDSVVSNNQRWRTAFQDKTEFDSLRKNSIKLFEDDPVEPKAGVARSLSSWIVVSVGTIIFLSAWFWCLFQVMIEIPLFAHTIGMIISCKLFTRLIPSLFNFSGLILAALSVPLARLLLLPPTHLIIAPEGFAAIRTSKEHFQNWMKGDAVISLKRNYLNQQYTTVASFKWHSIVRVSLDLKKTAQGAQILRFHTTDGKVVKVKLGDVLSQEVRAKLLSALKLWAPDAIIEPEAYALLEPLPDTSYTELWIAALSAPPTRERILPLLPGTVIGAGRYEIVQQLDSGGQATVYIVKAIGKSDRDTIVLKEYIMPIHVTRDAAKQSIESLEHEARMLKRLEHPQIVKLIDFFAEDYRGYMVLEHIHGKNLRKIVENSGALSEQETCRLAISMCDVLSYLHSQNPPVIHRDFTPDNLIVGDDGILKLIDFNVAQNVTNTVSARVVGKHAYMPPEQFRGKASCQSDLYALGACLYFLLVGVDPEPLSVLHPRDQKAAVSEALDRIVARCTEFSTDSRYQSAAEISSDLKCFVSSTIFSK